MSNDERFSVPGVGTRRLHEMTAEEVLAALDHHGAEAERLRGRADALETTLLTLLSRGLGHATPDDLAALVGAREEANMALVRMQRLVSRVLAQCPARYRNVPLKEGLPRWWGA
jgi:hypothetical protein